MRKLSLKMKLGMGFGTLLVILTFLGGIGYRAVVTTEAVSRNVQFNSTKKDLSLAIQLAIEKEKVGGRDALLNGSTKYLSAARAEFRDRMEALQPQLSSEQSRNLFAEIQQTTATYDGLADRAIELKSRGKTKEALEVFYGPDMQQVRANLKKSTTDLADWYERRKTEALDQQAASDASNKTLTLLLAGAGLVIGSLVTVLMVRSISGGISEIVGMIQEIAANNLAIEDISVISRDEIGKAGTALNSMKNNLRELIQSIARTAEHLASASEEISASAAQLAEGAETQKGQVMQVATAMQEMSATVREVSDNSNRAAEASRHAAQTACDGGKIVEDSLAKMRAITVSVSATAQKVEDLGKSSDQIGRIISVINDIADQTNLLALNAAIEAARAGEQGRGFAVVADEVRKLAERTTLATKEVAQMVERIQSGTKTAVTAMQSGTKQVEEGVETTSRAGDSLKQIIQTTEQVGDMITQIATAATEQSSATDQVNQNVDQITQLVGEAATGAQQSAKACEELSALALDLQNMVSKFRLDTHAGRSAGIPSRKENTSSSEATPADSTRSFSAGAS